MKKIAFTLAEVLITLGIIGVVAALTIPSLIQNYQKQVWVNQLKKSVSTFEQGFQKILADEGVDNLRYTEVWNKIEGDHSIDSNFEEINVEFFKEFKKYFSVVDYKWSDYGYEVAYLSKPSEPVDYFCEEILLADGSLLIGIGVFKNEKYAAEIAIDLNGRKKPNTYGRDVFLFIVTSDGHLVPKGSQKHVNIVKRQDYDFYWKTNPERCSNSSESSGAGCAGRIIEEGWKMNY